MKKIKTAVILVLVTFSLMNCSKEKKQEAFPVTPINLDMIAFVHSIKGWELYSWPNGKEWNYSVLVGTNRLKSYEEVTKNKIIVCGEDSLLMLLDKIPANEWISWIGQVWLAKIWSEGYGELSLPDDDILKEIKNYCDQKELILNIIK